MKTRTGKRGFAMVEILIAIGIVASLSAVALPNILRMRTNANDIAAKAAIRTIAYAAEDYAVRNGRYPTAIKELTQANPPYLSEDYTAAPQDGYAFTCSWSSTEYSCTASPVETGSTGNKVYTMASGLVQGESMAVITNKPTTDQPDDPITLARLKRLISEETDLNEGITVTGTTTPTNPIVDPTDDPGIIIVLDDPRDPLNDDGTPVIVDGQSVTPEGVNPGDDPVTQAVNAVNRI